MTTFGIGYLKKQNQPEGLPNYVQLPPSVTDGSPAPPVSGSSNEKDDDPDETGADDFERENENEFEVLQELEEGVRSLFDLFEQELLLNRTEKSILKEAMVF